MIGALIGLAVSSGLVMIAMGTRGLRVPTIEQRVAPWVRDVVHEQLTTSTWHRGLGDVLGRATRRLGEWVGSSASVERRLVKLGLEPPLVPGALEDFRGQQAWSGLFGFVGTFTVAVVVWQATGGHAVGLVVLCAVGFLGGAWWPDARLTRAVAAYELRQREEFPAVAELIALAVAAGESPLAAIDRVCQVSSGALADELARVAAEVRSGATVQSSLQSWAVRTGVVPIARFAEGLAIAMERGTPLVDVLHSQAADVREAGRRDLVESGGRREIAMMIPVVFLQLPVVVVFAFFPGLVSLSLTSGM